MYTMAKCKRNISGFDLAQFKAEALKLYADINRMVAEGDRSGLRHVGHYCLGHRERSLAALWCAAQLTFVVASGGHSR